ncbi:X2-like carbohydrate binding domain-containing protein [Bacillus sp. FJAT-45350]|uniref:X2-like carbohydrate binding domain-containing protein n=1 Tax=Bacillus sp. FJAT-45350 TaxID=2011014 RepID=UPI000BB6E9E2|nr:X2-like carbohydrate binding domain-containing protein [Bacillus sp. FJAT-45350]
MRYSKRVLSLIIITILIFLSIQPQVLANFIEPIGDSQFDKHRDKQVDLSFRLNSAAYNELALFKSGFPTDEAEYTTADLIELSLSDEHYFVSNDTLTLKREFLAEQSVGGLLMWMRHDTYSVTSFDLIIIDTTPVIITDSTQFDKNVTNQKDIEVIYNGFDSELSSIKLGDEVLNGGQHYTYTSADSVQFSKEFLSQQDVGMKVFKFHFDDGTEVDYKIEIIDTTIYNSTITPMLIDFDKHPSKREDIVVEMDLKGNTLEEIKKGPILLNRGQDYTVSGNKVTLKKEYLLKQRKDEPLELVFEFNQGNQATMRIFIYDTSEPPTAPVITLRGEAEIKFYVNTPYVDAGAIAYSETDGYIDTNIVRNSNVNVNEPGQYVVSYEVTDSTGRTALPVIRYVTVQPRKVTALSQQSGTIKVTGGFPAADVILYNKNNNRIAVTRLNRTGEAKFTNVPVDTGYYIKQVINYVESEASNKVNVSGPKPTNVRGSSGASGTIDVFGAEPRATIQLFDRSGNLIDSKRANRDGEYQFRRLDIGTGYFVVQSINGLNSVASSSVNVEGVGAARITGSWGGAETIDVTNAVPRANLTLYDNAGKQVMNGRADTNGRFQFRRVPVGSNYYVKQTVNRIEGPASNKANVSSTPQSIDVVNITGSNGGSGSIKVEGAEANATLRLFNNNNQLIATASANSSGMYEFKSVPNGSDYYVRQISKGMTSNQSNRVTVSGKKDERPIPTKPTQNRAPAPTPTNPTSPSNPGPAPVPPPQQPGETRDFSDIRGNWAEDSIKALARRGAIGGYQDGTFRPNNQITRAEFAAILVRAMNIQGTGTREFQDTRSHWAKDAIAIASENRIVNGYSKHQFGPNDPVTREQMVVMVARAGKLPIVDGGRTHFNDQQQISLWAEAYIHSIVESNIASGFSDNTFRPKQQATRAEAATIIKRMLQ